MEPAPPPPFPERPRKKGLPPLAWAGIGCGGLVVIAIIVFVVFAAKIGMSVAKKFNEHPAKAAAEAVIYRYPDVEKLSENAGLGEVTLRIKSSGEQIPTNYNDIVHGRVGTSSVEAPVPLFHGDLSKVPAWVPRYPGARGEISLLHEDLPDRIHGIISADTPDPVATVQKFFDDEITKFSSTSASRSSFDYNGAKANRLSYRSGNKELEINIYSTPGIPTTVETIYAEGR